MEVLDFTTGADLTLQEVIQKPWMKNKRFVLVTKDEGGQYPFLDEVISACSQAPKYALDLETTGLDVRVFNGETKAKIVGVCLSPDGNTGYYIPLRHQKNGVPSPYNVPISVFRKAFSSLMAVPNKAIFHNGKFDQEFLQFNGVEVFREWDEHAKWEDTLILAYLRDSRARQKGLKFLSKQELEMEMIELHELYGHETKRKNFKYDFSTLDPSKPSTLWYAASDAICTYLLHDKLAPQVLTGEHAQTLVYAVEKACVAATRWMERCRVYVDKAKVAELINIGQKELYLSLCNVYDAVGKELGRDVTPYYFLYLKEIVQATNPELEIDKGMSSLQNIMKQCRDEEHSMTPERKYPNLYAKKDRLAVTKNGKTFPAIYDVMSAQQLGPMLEELGVPDLPRTENSGQVKTSAEVLDEVLSKHGEQFPWIKHVQRYREVQKALSTYLIPLWEDSDPYDSTLKINFNAHKTDTGRFSAPSSEDPSRDGGTRFPMHGVPSTYDPDRPECMARLRECIKARPGKVMVALDFSGEELRIITNLSGEPKWLTEFFRCSGCGQTFSQGDGTKTPPPPPPFCPKCGSDKIGDIHTLTALSVYGMDAPKQANWKKLRGNSKSLNFAMAYGGSGRAAQRATGCDENEGNRLKATFDGSYLTLSAWWKKQHDFGRKYGYVLTAFGRKCPVPDIQLPRVWVLKNGKKSDSNGGFRSKAERNATNAPIQGCLAPESRILTDRGSMPIADLYQLVQSGQYKEPTLWTGTKWEPAQVVFTGEKTVCRTTLSNGRILKTSPDHKVLVASGRTLVWKAQSELQQGDWVAMNAASVDYPEPIYHWESVRVPQQGHLFHTGQTPHNKKSFSFHGNSQDMWEFLGMVYGDGSIREDSLSVVSSNTPRFPDFSSEKYIKEWVTRLNTQLGVGAVAYQETTQPQKWWLHVWNKEFRTFCQETLGVDTQTTHTKHFPRALWKESPANQAAFLRGYFSADGTGSPNCDAFSVRSANQALLKETQELLSMLGIRSGWRAKSLRVTVHDRVRFREHVGFNIAYKAERLSRMRLNAQTDQRHQLPPTFVSWAGKNIRESSLYTTLPKGQKSAVFRMLAGSASKPQCQKYLDQLQDSETSVDLLSCLKYDYCQVVSSEQTKETVGMYDIILKDGIHAFVCDGAIVHNSGSDIIKIAMARVYRLCKERGWLQAQKVFMIATMHDELVFEIDLDILEEAIDAIGHEMTSNDLVIGRKWRVPLTYDVECGPDWTVHWNITQMRHGKTPWAEEIKPYFKKALNTDVETQPVAQTAPVAQTVQQTSGENPVSQVEHPPLAVPQIGVEQTGSPVLPSQAPGIPVQRFQPIQEGSVDNGVFTYTLKNMKMSKLNDLALLLKECMGRGSAKLRLLSPTGQEIPLKGFPDLRVSPQQFQVLAEYRGL